MVPLDDRGHLNARDLLVPNQLGALQTEYAQAMAPLGLIRGVAGSKARHLRGDTGYLCQRRALIPAISPRVLQPGLLYPRRTRSEKITLRPPLALRFDNRSPSGNDVHLPFGKGYRRSPPLALRSRDQKRTSPEIDLP